MIKTAWMTDYLKILKISFAAILLSCVINLCMAQEIYTLKNTKLVQGIRYDTNKKPINGILRMYYPTGELLLEATYKDGKLNGISRGYRPDGTLLQEIIYNEAIEIKKNTYSDKIII